VTDRFGRTLANIYLERGGQLVNVSLWLAEQGWARSAWHLLHVGLALAGREMTFQEQSDRPG
jgi:hypothetical protein